MRQDACAALRFVDLLGVLGAKHCNRIIAASEPHLALCRAGTSRTCWEHVLTDAELAALLPDAIDGLERILFEIAGVPPSHREPWRAVRYRPGQEFREHHDRLSRREARCDAGQRTTSLILYLCDVAAGGITRFRALDLSVRPVLGRLIAWQNITPRGAPLHQAIHAGIAPIGQDKWILTTWYREHPVCSELSSREKYA